MRVSQDAAARITLALNAYDCAECGVVFAVTAEFDQRRRASGNAFYCPNGHTLVYSGRTLPTVEVELKEAKARQRQAELTAQFEREQAESALRSLAATKGVVTRLKRRAANGTCPCCHRTFAQLARHMQAKHPAFVAEQRES